MHLVLFLEHRPQFVMIQALSIFEVHPQDITECLFAMRYSVPQITHGHQVAYLKRLALLDEQFQHDFEGWALTLQGAGDRHDRLHERRAEWIYLPEHLPVSRA